MRFREFSGDFYKFWFGQFISNLGSSFTIFVLPLLIFKLTGSAINLALSSAANFLPYLIFGLVIGAWVDRVDRKRLMIYVDISRALIILLLPLLSMVGLLSVWWIYIIGFLTSTFTICFNAAQFAAIPSLVSRENLVTANGRIQASFSTARVVAPLLAGLLVVIIPMETLLIIDSLTFFISVISLTLISTKFNATTDRRRLLTGIWSDIGDGLRYVLGHPVLRNISVMIALVNFVRTTVVAQIVLFAERHLNTDASQISLFYSVGAMGVVVLSLLAEPLRSRLSFSKVILGTLMFDSIAIVALSMIGQIWLALPLWALLTGLGSLFNINTGSLRQAIVPSALLGRVQTVAAVLAWSIIPLGSLLGGLLIEWTDDVALIYRLIGGLELLIAIGFSFTALGYAELYLPQEKASGDMKPAVISQ